MYKDLCKMLIETVFVIVQKCKQPNRRMNKQMGAHLHSGIPLGNKREQASDIPSVDECHLSYTKELYKILEKAKL